MSLRRLIVIALSIVGALLLAIMLYLGFADLGRHKSRIEAVVTKKIGRPFAIDGTLQLKLFPAIRVLAERVRLGNAERALACVEGIETTPDWKDLEPYVRAGRALAYRQLGRVEAGAAEAERLRQLAATETADTQVISLWREVEATLR